MPFSRAIEVNPATNEIVWKYQDRPAWNFFSPRMGNAQRLPNGFFAGSPDTQGNLVFRALRYSAEEIARAKATAGS